MVYSNILFVLVISLFLQKCQCIPRLDPLVETKVGLIRGLKASDGDYSMFMGIPFAKVDENNPFGPSIPHPGFDDTFDAYDDSAICPQVEEFNNTIVGSLDCLYLNIYVPNTASSRNRVPVLVWIYGGGFSIGFAGRYLYGPKYLVRHDIILVTINYRLGPYGFMCLDTPEVPGNQGLKDQLIALRWINDNIESFGGDINKITIFGESAGGMSVDLHLYSTQENLFNSVILESGTAMLDLLGEPDNTAPLKLSEQLGFMTSNVNEALSFLSSIDTKLIIAAANHIDVSFRACVENDFDGVAKFVPDYTVNRNVPKAKGIPILLGVNNNEWLSTYANQEAAYFEHLDEFNARLTSHFNFNGDKLSEMEQIVRHFYIGDDKLSTEHKYALADFASDISFNHPAERSIERYIDNGADKVFQYVFSYNGGRNFAKRKNNITIGGAVHADEIGYLFDILLWTEDPTPEDQLMVDRMTTMWANFVKYGDPTPETSDILPVKWEPITKHSAFYYFNIDLELSVGTRPFNDRMAFWDLFYKSNWNSQKGYREN